jgi:hypothetical protein
MTCIVPWAAVALVVFLTACINHTIDLGALSYSGTIPDGEINPASSDLPLIAKHLLARIGWGVPAIGFGLVSIAVAAVGMFVVATSFSELGRERFRYAAVIALAAIGLLLVAAYLGNQIMSEPDVTTALRKATLHRTVATHAVAVDSSFDVVSYALFLLLSAAASAALVMPAKATHTIAQVCDRIKHVQWLLYVGAVALVLRDVEMYMLYRWPQVWFAKEQAEAIDHMALALSTAHGAFFSAILIALYLPTVLILRGRAKSIATYAVVGTDEAPQAWLQKAGVDASPFKELANVFATIAPLLAGGTVAKIAAALAG